MDMKSLIDSGHLSPIATSSDSTMVLYQNTMIATGMFSAIVMSADLATIVGNEVFSRLNIAMPFASAEVAVAAMEQLIALGGLAAIPDILGVSPVTPIAVAPVPIPTGVAGFGLPTAPPVVPEAPIESASTVTKAKRTRRSAAQIAADKLAAEQPTAPPVVPVVPVVPEAPIADLVDTHTLTADDLPGVDYSDPEPLPTPEPKIVTSIAETPETAVDTVATAEDYQGTAIAEVIAQADQLTKGLIQVVTERTEAINRAIAGITVAALSPTPIAPDPTPTSAPVNFPIVVNKPSKDGITWLLILGKTAEMTAEQAIVRATDLGTIAGVNLGIPAPANTQAFGQVYYIKLAYTEVERVVCGVEGFLEIHNL
jgi:hypothetical protein